MINLIQSVNHHGVIPPLPKGIESWMRRNVVQNHYLFYRTETKTITCTNCGRTFPVDDLRQSVKIIKSNQYSCGWGGSITDREERYTGGAHHGAITKCPHCRHKAIMYNAKFGRKKLTRLENLIVLGRRGSTFYIVNYELDIVYTGCPDGTIVFDMLVQSVFKFPDGAASECLKYDSRFNLWHVAKETEYPFRSANAMYGFEPRRSGYFLYCKNFKSAFSAGRLRYSRGSSEIAKSDSNIQEIKRYVIEFRKFQSIELLEKSGFGKFVDSRISRGETEYFASINWKGASLRKILGLDMGHIRYFRRVLNANLLCKIRNCVLYGFSLYKKSVLTGRPISEDALQWFCGNYDTLSLSMMNFVLKLSTFDHLYEYIVKQEQTTQRQKRYKYWRGLHDWIDYIVECKQLQLDFTNKTVLFPKSLVKAHSRTGAAVRELNEAIRAREKEEASAKRAKQAAAMTPLILKTGRKISGMSEPYSFGGLTIRPAQSGEEIVAEGTILSHCVASYVGKMANGKTAIMLIRREDDPDTPYYTLELSPERVVVQVRGKLNCTVTEEVKSFIERWMSEVILRKEFAA